MTFSIYSNLSQDYLQKFSNFNMKYFHSLILQTLFTIFTVVEASPTNSYPLALQFPPVILVDKPYSYQLPADTFTSSSDQLKYSVSGLPDWLSFDSDSRTISGTAPSSYFSSTKWSEIWFELLATDSTGQTTVNSSLAISNMDLAKNSATYNLNSDLTSPGVFSSARNLILTPNEDFYVSFKPDIFQASSPISQYKALTSSHEPLPIWLNFDTSSLSFSGRPPAVNSDIASSDSYSISIMAIQIPGYSSANVDFEITIGAHQFTTKITSANQSITPGEAFIYNIPLDKMSLDKNMVSISNISKVTVDPQPDWLAVDNSSIALYGNIPTSFKNSTHTLTITNTYNDTVKFDLFLYEKAKPILPNDADSMESIFKQSSLPVINVSNSEFFQYELPESAVNTTQMKNSNITVSYDPVASWLTFHKSNLTLVGDVPSSFSGTTVTLENNKNQNDLLSLTIRSVSTVRPSAVPTATTSSLPSLKKNNNHLVAIICGTVIPVVTIFLLVIIYFCCIRRKEPRRAVISAPFPPNDENEVGRSHENAPSIMTGGAFSSTDKVSSFFTPILSGPLQKEKEAWDSPTIATEFNMYKLDNPKLPYLQYRPSLTNQSLAGSEMTQIGEENHPVIPMRSRTLDTAALSNTTLSFERALTPSGIHPTHTRTPDVLQAPVMINVPSAPDTKFTDHDELPFTPGKPRNSWRKSKDPTHKQHARNQGGSLATIATDELVSVRMVDEARKKRLSNNVLRDSSVNIVHAEHQSDDTSDYDHYESPSSRPESKSISIGTYSSMECENPYIHPVNSNSANNNLESSTQIPESQSVVHGDLRTFRFSDTANSDSNFLFTNNATSNAKNSIRIVKE